MDSLTIRGGGWVLCDGARRTHCGVVAVRHESEAHAVLATPSAAETLSSARARVVARSACGWAQAQAENGSARIEGGLGE